MVVGFVVLNKAANVDQAAQNKAGNVAPFFEFKAEKVWIKLQTSLYKLRVTQYQKINSKNKQL